MFKLNSRLFSGLTIIVFGTALALAFLFNSYELAVSGMLIIILLTAFIPGWRSTLAAGVAGMVAMTALVLYFKDDSNNITKELLSQVYSLFVILFAVIIVFFLK